MVQLPPLYKPKTPIRNFLKVEPNSDETKGCSEEAAVPLFSQNYVLTEVLSEGNLVIRLGFF